MPPTNSVINVNKEALKIHSGPRINDSNRDWKRKKIPQMIMFQKTGPANRNHISTTDPDASVSKQGGGPRRSNTKPIGSVDGKAEVIPATEAHRVKVTKAHFAIHLLAMHQDHTQTTVEKRSLPI